MLGNFFVCFFTAKLIQHMAKMAQKGKQFILSVYLEDNPTLTMLFVMTLYHDNVMEYSIYCI